MQKVQFETDKVCAGKWIIFSTETFPAGRFSSTSNSFRGAEVGITLTACSGGYKNNIQGLWIVPYLVGGTGEGWREVICGQTLFKYLVSFVQNEVEEKNLFPFSLWNFLSFHFFSAYGLCPVHLNCFRPGRYIYLLIMLFDPLLNFKEHNPVLGLRILKTQVKFTNAFLKYVQGHLEVLSMIIISNKKIKELLFTVTLLVFEIMLSQ